MSISTRRLLAICLGMSLVLSIACEEPKQDKRAAAEEAEDDKPGVSAVNPIAIAGNAEAFGFLSKMQGHWVGSNVVSGVTYNWFAFDYRAISSSHVFGIYEGGTMGNLLTSFFVADYKGAKTIMARNGGVLGDLYRSSYFVMDAVTTEGDSDCFQFVDAVGGLNIMSMKVCFDGEAIDFKSYRSSFGSYYPPELHMHFKATKENPDLASTAATTLSFPSQTSERDFSSGFTTDDLYRNEGTEAPVSATFLYQGTGELAVRAAAAKDPYTAADHGHIAELRLDVTRGTVAEGKKLFVFLSKDPLTDSNGQTGGNTALNSVLQFPVLDSSSSSYTFVYLHPGSYYVTVISDTNGDGTFSSGDAATVSEAMTFNPRDVLIKTISDFSATY